MFKKLIVSPLLCDDMLAGAGDHRLEFIGSRVKYGSDHCGQVAGCLI